MSINLYRNNYTIVIKKRRKMNKDIRTVIYAYTFAPYSRLFLSELGVCRRR